ncbi:hypothetical protein VEE68_24280 [Escherichia coli]|nr:hypothetical protein VEE68_24280 [Escherichia coli]
MAQITTTDANEFSSSAEFTPMRGFSNCHLQTMLPRLFRRQVKFTPYWQRLELPDGDFVDLAWSEDPAQAKHKPRLVVFHGLEGSLNSPYAHGLVEAAQKRGWLGVVMHFRGCSGEPNRMHRIFTIRAKPKTPVGFYAGCNANLVMRQRLPSAIRSAVICWPVC